MHRGLWAIRAFVQRFRVRHQANDIDSIMLFGSDPFTQFSGFLCFPEKKSLLNPLRVKEPGSKCFRNAAVQQEQREVEKRNQTEKEKPGRSEYPELRRERIAFRRRPKPFVEPKVSPRPTRITSADLWNLVWKEYNRTRTRPQSIQNKCHTEHSSRDRCFE